MNNHLAWVGRLLVLCVLLYLFFLGLDLMSLAFKLFGKGFAERLIETTSNPFLGLFVGILATSLVQSSSTTTSMTVALVGAGALTIEGSIPIIMGANIGTSVTNTLVSLGHASRPEEFRRAFAGATIHDFFNWMAVLILFPLELTVGLLARTAALMEKLLEGSGGISLLDPVKVIVRPVGLYISDLVGESAAFTLIAGVLALFLALKYLVTLLKAILSSQAERILHRTLFRSAFAAMLAGIAITVMVQSSSITTSVMVPLVGAGVVTLEQVFPFTIGANIGTTVTAILAALSLGSATAVTVALTHLNFNLIGALIIYGIPPIRRIPLALARYLGDVGARSRPLAIFYIGAVFFGLPLLLLFLTGSFDSSPAAEPPAVQKTTGRFGGRPEPPPGISAGPQGAPRAGKDRRLPEEPARPLHAWERAALPTPVNAWIYSHEKLPASNKIGKEGAAPIKENLNV